MKTMRFPGLVCVALAMFALPAAAKTPDGVTPANETICDPLADATPGLYGLCVAMCEAQDCEAEFDANNGEVVYDPSCSPASDQLLANYNRKKVKSDPPMPCVKVACPCWTELELDNITGPSTSCSAQPGDTWANLMGPSTDGPGWEWAFVSDDAVRGFMCSSMEQNPPFYRDRNISEAEYLGCLQAVIDQCSERRR